MTKATQKCHPRGEVPPAQVALTPAYALRAHARSVLSGTSATRQGWVALVALGPVPRHPRTHKPFKRTKCHICHPQAASR